MPSLDLAINRAPTDSRPPLDQMPAPLLHKHQLKDMQEQVARLESSVKDAGKPYGGTANVGDTRRAIGRVKKQIEAQKARPYEPGEMDAAVAAEKQLREDILKGMPTAEEMRKKPPGAVDKHIAWERRSKKKILARKNILLRLQASGALGSEASDASDIGSVERLREHSNGHQLSMDNAAIPGRKFFFTGTDIDPGNVMTDAEREAAEMETIVLMRRIGQMPTTERGKLLAKLMGA